MKKKDSKAQFSYLSYNELGELMKLFNKYDREAPLQIADNTKANWIEWYAYLKESTQSNIKIIFTRYIHLDTKLINLLTKVENSFFVTQFHLMTDKDAPKELSMYCVQTSAYLKIIQDLEHYAEKNFKNQKNLKSSFYGFEHIWE